MKKTLLAWLSLLGANALFLFSCFVAAADGQGAILFIFTFPALFSLLVLAIFLTRRGQTGDEGAWKKGAQWLSRATLVVTLAFLIFSFIPGLNLFSKAVMDGVSFVFQSATGKTPYAWVRARNHISVKIADALKDRGGQELDLREVSPSYRWDSVCFFGPYTTDLAAAKVLQLPFEWKLSDHSKVGLSDGVNALVFLFDYNGRGVSYVVDINRSQADFAKLSGRCFPKEKARFVRIASGSTEFGAMTN